MHTISRLMQVVQLVWRSVYLIGLVVKRVNMYVSIESETNVLVGCVSRFKDLHHAIQE